METLRTQMLQLTHAVDHVHGLVSQQAVVGTPAPNSAASPAAAASPAPYFVNQAVQTIDAAVGPAIINQAIQTHEEALEPRNPLEVERWREQIDKSTKLPSPRLLSQTTPRQLSYRTQKVLDTHVTPSQAGNASWNSTMQVEAVTSTPAPASGSTPGRMMWDSSTASISHDMGNPFNEVMTPFNGPFSNNLDEPNTSVYHINMGLPHRFTTIAPDILNPSNSFNLTTFDTSLIPDIATISSTSGSDTPFTLAI